MKLPYLTFVLFFVSTLFISSCSNPTGSASSNQRIVLDFNEQWKFLKDTANHQAWQEIQLPHSMKIEPLVVNDMWQGTAWYKKSFKLGPQKGKKAFLYFEGVMHEANIYLNGVKIANHKGGFLPFSIDLTNQLAEGKDNEILVKVNNEDNPMIPPGKAINTLDFSYYGGIYRDVQLLLKNDVYITDAVHANKANSGGVLIHFTEISPEIAKGIVKIHVKNESDKPKRVQFKASIGSSSINSNKVTIYANSDTTLEQTIEIAKPKLWSPQAPELYNATINLLVDGEINDHVETRTGIRKIELAEDGFRLNGEKIFIRGTNRHQEYPYVGYAISDSAQYRDAVKIKNAGFDLVRLSHYPQDEAFLAACDELGIIVMNCISGWQFIGNEEFVKNSHQEIRDLARRDRNHPSVFFWEISLNESGMDDAYMTRANEILDEELPYKDIFSVAWIDHPSYDLFIPARQHGKAPDYWNFYKEGKRKVFIAEYGDWEYYAQNAGFNQTAFADLSEAERTSRQLRGDGETRLLQQAMNFQEATNSNRKGEGTIGHANWVMFDYNRGYADDLEASGISDIFRIPKFAYHFYQSQRPSSETYSHPGITAGPMVKIASYWTKNSPKKIRVYSNTEEVALSLNGKLIAKQKSTLDKYSSHLGYPYFVFEIPAFDAGELKAEGFVSGKKVCEDLVKSPKTAKAIQLEIDLSGVSLAPNSADVAFIYAKVVDENGTIIPTAQHTIKFNISSNEAQLIGENPFTAEAGIASILLRTSSFTKEITITAEAEGLVKSSLTIPIQGGK
ncbi:glycoside hydrolase family 2 TIM barrel-domain containing protein [Flammeovirgaceae bacterium SG7u.111]|nr:glycoside hydrolase family 2 TIM barrel-domain containing protein [Flammeovirgaceae bacterium SG7u.132]WPO33677.1 glycoside hydrolase family 2 TIM barrel-domain containing protein [Flammeovirgaceae bacterium SG7u.111]